MQPCEGLGSCREGQSEWGLGCARIPQANAAVSPPQLPQGKAAWEHWGGLAQ